MKTGKRIPIKTAKEIGKYYGYTQVIIHAYDGQSGIQHITTWGESMEDCDNAALGGNEIKKLLKWEDSDAVPNRVKKLQDEILELKKLIRKLYLGEKDTPEI
jgi:hypothetical protein